MGGYLSPGELYGLGQEYVDPNIDFSQPWTDESGAVTASYGAPGEITAPSGYSLPMELQSLGLDPRLAWSWWAQWANPWAGYSRFANQSAMPSPPPTADFGVSGFGAAPASSGLFTKRNIVIGSVLAGLLYMGARKSRKGAIRLRNPVKGAEKVIKLVLGSKKRRKKRHRRRARRR